MAARMPDSRYGEDPVLFSPYDSCQSNVSLIRRCPRHQGALRKLEVIISATPILTSYCFRLRLQPSTRPVNSDVKVLESSRNLRSLSAAVTVALLV